jgi:hypothetical protein
VFDVFESFFCVFELEVVLCDAEDADEWAAGYATAVDAVTDAREEGVVFDCIGDGTTKAGSCYGLHACSLPAAIAVLERSLGIEVTAPLTIKMLSASVQPAWIRLHIFSDLENY